MRRNLLDIQREALNPCVRAALLWHGEGIDTVRCGVCERRCLIKPGVRGFCKTRENREGNLYTLVYGNVSALSANPIEKGGEEARLPRESPSTISGLAAQP